MVFPLKHVVNVDRCPLVVRSRIVALKVLTQGHCQGKGGGKSLGLRCSTQNSLQFPAPCQQRFPESLCPERASPAWVS